MGTRRARRVVVSSEEAGGFVFRVRDAGRRCPAEDTRFEAAAKRVAEPFVADELLFEPLNHDVWFEFGSSPEEALGKLKAGLFN